MGEQHGKGPGRREFKWKFLGRGDTNNRLRGSIFGLKIQHPAPKKRSKTIFWNLVSFREQILLEITKHPFCSDQLGLDAGFQGPGRFRANNTLYCIPTKMQKNHFFAVVSKFCSEGEFLLESCFKKAKKKLFCRSFEECLT